MCNAPDKRISRIVNKSREGEDGKRMGRGYCGGGREGGGRRGKESDVRKISNVYKPSEPRPRRRSQGKQGRKSKDVFKLEW